MSTMRRGALAVLPLLATLVAGCTVQLPDAATPEDLGTEWTDAGADLWVVRDEPCGFGSGADEACASFTLLYRDGSVLRALYGEGGPRQLEGVPREEGDRSGLTFAFPGEHGAYRDEISDAWNQTRGQAPDLVRVHAVQAYRIQPTEREDVLRVVEHALRQAEDLPDPSFDCADCSAPAYWSFGAPRAFEEQRFGSPAPTQKGWRLLEDQVEALHGWLDSHPAPA